MSIIMLTPARVAARVERYAARNTNILILMHLKITNLNPIKSQAYVCHCLQYRNTQ